LWPESKSNATPTPNITGPRIRLTDPTLLFRRSDPDPNDASTGLIDDFDDPFFLGLVKS
jgi:hypothetical protein